MTPLRQKMIKAMELRNFSKHTQRYYLSVVTELAWYYQQPTDKFKYSKKMTLEYFCDSSYFLLPNM
jgi:hypothetical protein